MRKKVMLGLLAAYMVLTAFGGDINGTFKADNNKRLPSNWNQNLEAWAKPYGIVSAIFNEDKTSGGVKIVSTEKSTQIFTGVVILCEEGDVVTITVKAKGKGKLEFGLMAYSKENTWLYTAHKEVAVSDTITDYKNSIAIKDGDKKEANGFRLYITAMPDSEIIAESIDFEMAKAK